MNIELIAKTAYEVNAVLCRTLGDYTQPPWADAADWQKDSVRSGVFLHINNPDTTPEQSHISWIEEKVNAGWTYGPTKDPDKKLHPCLVPYSELPVEQQAKDVLFGAVMHALIPLLPKGATPS